MEFSGDQVDVTFQVNKDVRARITNSSVATLGSVSLLGEARRRHHAVVEGDADSRLGLRADGQDGGRVRGPDRAGASEGIDEITKLVKDVRAGKGTLGKLMTDEKLYDELETFVATAGEVTRTIRQGQGTIGRLVNDPKIANSLEASLKNLEDMTRRINAGEGSLGKLLNDDGVSPKSLTGATTNLQTLTDRLNKGEGTAGKLMTDPALFNQLKSLADRLDDLAKRLNSGEGTVGQLLKDKQLYENMNGAVNDVRALVEAIKKDPKKYLNVKVSIF